MLKINFGIIAAALIALLSCTSTAKKAPVPVLAWGGPELSSYTESSCFPRAFDLAIRTRGVERALAAVPRSLAALERAEEALQAYAAGHGMTLNRGPANLPTLAVRTSVLIADDPNTDLRPVAYEKMAELGRVLNDFPELLVVVHSHTRFFAAPDVTMRTGFADAVQVTRVLREAGQVPGARLASYGCLGEEGWTFITLVPQEGAASYLYLTLADDSIIGDNRVIK